MAEHVVEQRVAAQLVKAALARPVFDRRDQFPSDAGAADVVVDPPAFDERAWLLVDAVGEGSHAGFDHAAQAGVRPLGDKDHLVRAGEQPVEFAGQVLHVLVGPERGAHAHVLGPIRCVEWADARRWHFGQHTSLFPIRRNSYP